jgi:hypothetical protein
LIQSLNIQDKNVISILNIQSFKVNFVLNKSFFSKKIVKINIKSTFVTQYLFQLMLENIITSKTRLRLLVKFFINVANEGYLRGLATEMQESTNSIRKELNNLTEAGYLIRTEENLKVTYKANQTNPFFKLLQQIVRKYVGLDTIITMVIDKIGNVKKVYLIGDYVKGIDSGIIEIVLEGNDLNTEYIAQLSLKIEKEIQREVVFTLTNQHDNSGLLLYEHEVLILN